DIAMSVYQKVFDNGTVEDYDLVEMLKDASEKVKTQKILLIAHSQGNFYANSFYDVVAGKDGGVSEESIGVYSVATPAGRVAGGGKWLTSDTDKVIAGVVNRAPFKKIMSPNTSIILNDGDDLLGHNFKDIYLKYRGKEIVSDIKESLDKLKEDSNQDQLKNCIDPPKLTLAHKVEGAILSVVDPKAQAIKDGSIIVGKGAYQSGVAVVNMTKKTVSVIGGLAKLPFQSDQKYVVGNQAVSLYAIKDEKNDVPAIAVSVADKKFEETPLVIVQPIFPQKEFSDKENLARIQSSLDDIKNQIIILEQRKLTNDNVSKPPSETKNLFLNNEDKKLSAEKPNGPRLLFIGTNYPGFGGGGEVVQMQTATIKQTNETNEESVLEETLSAPILIATQCSYSLALDGCLLATTTVVFSWAGIHSATHYAINKNGEYATTTELSFSANISDFSDYNFSVSAVSSATTSATTTVQTVSVATIPIAINEIAWMGTTASSYDEWLELKNNTGHRINLSQWAIESADNLPYIALAGEMSPYEYRILERRTNTITASSIISVYGNGSSQWALGNNGEELILSYASTTLDKSPAITGDTWTAGENTSSTTRKTMERIDTKQSGATSTNWTTWGTNINFIKNGQDADGNQISGTPGECNSASYSNLNNDQSITGDLTLTKNDCYYTSAGSSVSATGTLAIEEGVRISLYQNNLVVNGVIIASGTPDNPIIIDSFSGTPTSNSVKISGSNGTSTMDNVIISNTGGIYLNNSASLEISNAEFTNNRYGVELNNNSSVVIGNANFASTTREALSAYNGSSISVSSSTISNTIDGDAIGIYDSNLTISSTTIDIVLEGDGIGAYDSTVSIASSTVSNVLDGDGIGLYDSTTTISNVVVENVSGDGIAVYGGSVSGNATIDGVGVEF
ncbi:MAG: hypothetical protein AAB962_01595, partial [Patescibacteria group bacterium]